jgi:hypothetical protein
LNARGCCPDNADDFYPRKKSASRKKGRTFFSFAHTQPNVIWHDCCFGLDLDALHLNDWGRIVWIDETGVGLDAKLLLITQRRLHDLGGNVLGRSVIPQQTGFHLNLPVFCFLLRNHRKSVWGKKPSFSIGNSVLRLLRIELHDCQRPDVCFDMLRQVKYSVITTHAKTQARLTSRSGPTAFDCLNLARFAAPTKSLREIPKTLFLNLDRVGARGTRIALEERAAATGTGACADAQ